MAARSICGRFSVSDVLPTDPRIRLALGSVLIGVLVLGLKFVAYRLTGSVALYSDALESIINVVAALAAVMAVSFSARPADANHPYGYAKAEYLSAVLEGVLIVIAALGILHAAWGGLQAPQSLQSPGLGMLVNAAASVINGAWAWVLGRQGKRLRSAALLADGRHLMSDVVSSMGVLVGVGLVLLTGWLVLDPLLAIAVALNILWSGWALIRESVDGLMDGAPSDDVLATIRAVVDRESSGALEAHDLRTRMAGHTTFIELHLVVDGSMTVDASHAICDRIQAALIAAVEGAFVTIHVEPPAKAKNRGRVSSVDTV